MNKKEKIKHGYKCDICGKPAKYNVQEQIHKYEIDEKGNFVEVDVWEGNENRFLCESCEESEY